MHHVTNRLSSRAQKWSNVQATIYTQYMQCMIFRPSIANTLNLKTHVLLQTLVRHGFLAVRSWSSVHLVPIGVVGLGATAVADVLLQVVSPSSGHHQGRRDGRGGAGASHGGLLAQAPLPWLLCPSKSLSITLTLVVYAFTLTPSLLVSKLHGA
jgi:hypothetical protein